MNDVKFTNNAKKAKEALQEAVEQALEAIGIQAEGYAKLELENSPRRIDTGRLRNSISHETEKDAAYIGTDVEYALYVHEGTERMAPNRFLKNAATKYADEYKQIAEKYMQQADV